MSRKARWALGIAIVLFIAATAWNVAARITTQTKTTSSLSSVVDVIEDRCMQEEQRDRQIKVRGEAELALLDLFLDLARKEQTSVSEAFVEHFEPLTRKIKIIPLPDCARQGDELRANLPPG
jgi:CRISPR/Cas system CSM-associated protein Csm2 small subunit